MYLYSTQPNKELLMRFSRRFKAFHRITKRNKTKGTIKNVTSEQSTHDILNIERNLMLVYKRSYLLVIVFIPFLLFGCTHYAKTDWFKETITKSDSENLYEVQLAAKTYSASGLPDVLMIGMCHVGYPEYYDKVREKLTESDIVIAEGCSMIYTPYSTLEEQQIAFIESLKSVASIFASNGEITLPLTVTKLSTILEDEDTKEKLNDPYRSFAGKQLYKDLWGNDVMFYPEEFNSVSDTTSPGMLCSYGLNGVWDGDDVDSDDIAIPIEKDPWWEEVRTKLEGYEAQQYLTVENLDDAVSQWYYLLPEDNWIPGDWKSSNYKEHFKSTANYLEVFKLLMAEKDKYKVWWLNPYHYWVRVSYHWEKSLIKRNGGNPSKPFKFFEARNDRVWELIRFHISENPKSAKTIGIPWGWTHMPGFEERLLNEFGYNKVDEEWITIWSDSRTSSKFINTITHDILRRRTAQQLSGSQKQAIDELLNY